MPGRIYVGQALEDDGLWRISGVVVPLLPAQTDLLVRVARIQGRDPTELATFLLAASIETYATSIDKFDGKDAKPE